MNTDSTMGNEGSMPSGRLNDPSAPIANQVSTAVDSTSTIFPSSKPSVALLGHSTLLSLATPLILLSTGIKGQAVLPLTFSSLAAFLIFTVIFFRWHSGASLTRQQQILRLLALMLPSSALATLCTFALMGIIDGEFPNVSSRDLQVVFQICAAVTIATTFLPLMVANTSLLSEGPLGRYFVFTAGRQRPYDSTSQSLDLFSNAIGLTKFLAETPSSRIAAIEDLRQRGRRLRTVNSAILSFVMLILISAALFVVFAGQIAGRDTQSLDSLLTLRQSIDSQETAVRELEDERVNISEKLTKSQVLLAAKSISEKDKSDSETTIAVQKSRLVVVSERSVRAANELQRRRELYGKLEQAALLERSGMGDEKTATNLLLAAGITRFGVLAITIYLVQILIGLYRYNAQVAAHYFSQSDALLLTGHSASDFGDLSTKLRLTVSFGKVESSVPERTLDKLSEIVKAAADRVRGPAESVDKK